jgi:hypothetical protein
MEAVTPHAGVVKLGRQRESLRDVWIRAVERRVEAGHLRELRRALEQQGDRQQIMGLVQRRERDEALQRLERRRLDPHGRRVVQTPVDDPVADADQSVVRELVLQEVAEILNRAIVTELPPRPGLFGDDAARRILRHEAGCRVEALDLSPHLERELADTLGKGGELDARGAAVQNEDGVVGFRHCGRPPWRIATAIPSARRAPRRSK